MKKIIIPILSILIIFIIIICVENMVVVCEVIYTDNIENKYAEILEENNNLNCFLMSQQVVTEGTEYHAEGSTGIAQIDSCSKDIILKNWINPAFLMVNNDFALSGQVKYVIILPSNAVIETKRKYNENVVCVSPQKTIMLTQNTEIFCFADNGKFYVRDLSLLGHIRFYFGYFLPFLRSSI